MFKRVVHATAFLLAAVAIVVSPRDLQAAQPVFPLHVSGQFIVDSNNARVRMNAVNWSGAETTDYVVAGLQVATLQNIVQQIKNLGFNVVRLPWSNQGYESNPVVEPVTGYDPSKDLLAANPGMRGKNYLTIMDQVVSALTNAGIMVVLDNHVSIAGWCCGSSDGNTLWYNSQYPESSWIADWQGIVQRYASNPLVIGADLRNEPRSSQTTAVTWGGDASTDWHAAAQRGGNAVLAVNPNLIIFVEGINYARDLSGVRSLPIQLNVSNHMSYEVHDYGFQYSPALTGYTDYVSRITPKWGYLLAGTSPQPIWVGEFGTCNSSDACVSSTSSSSYGYWFGFLTSYINSHNLDWCYWPVNGTAPTGNGPTWGAPEGYAVLNPTYSGSALASLTSRLQWLMTAANAGSGPANGTYKLINVNSGLSMSIDSSSLSNGASVLQWQYESAPAEKWNLNYLGNGFYTLKNGNSGLALDVTGQSISGGAFLEQWSYWGGGNQQYMVIPTGSGSYTIVNANSGLLAEVQGNSGTNGARIDQWTLNSGGNQQWLFQAP